jgi:hypothetical protein
MIERRSTTRCSWPCSVLRCILHGKEHTRDWVTRARSSLPSCRPVPYTSLQSWKPNSTRPWRSFSNLTKGLPTSLWRRALPSFCELLRSSEPEISDDFRCPFSTFRWFIAEARPR